MAASTVHFQGKTITAAYEAVGVAFQHFERYTHTDRGMEHGHAFLEITYLLSGTACHRIGTEEHQVGPGSLGIIHYGESHELVTPPEGIEVINLYLDLERHALPSLPEAFSRIICGLFPPGPLPGKRRELVAFLQFDPPEKLGALLRYLWDEQQQAQPGYELVLQDGLRMVLIACARAAAGQQVVTFTENNAHWQPMEMLRQRLDREYARPHRLDDLAHDCGYAKEYLCRQFKAYTGVPVFTYLQQRRIQHAMRLLRTTDKKVLSIAMECGFNDLTHFNRTFRTIAGCAPRAFRQKEKL